MFSLNVENICEYFCEIFPVSHNIVMSVNNVMRHEIIFSCEEKQILIRMLIKVFFGMNMDIIINFKA